MNRLIAAFTMCVFTAAPILARAQPAQAPDECTTTTTVHCTGAAARYAVQPPAPEQPPPPAQPPPIPPPVYYPPPPPMYPQGNVVMLDLRKLEDDGWKLVQGGDGTLWRERKVTTSNGKLWGAGLAIFTLSWMGSGIGSVTSSDLGPLGFLPVFGAFANAIAASGHDSCNYDNGGYNYVCNDHKGAVAGWAIGGILQAAGFTMFLIGLASGPKKIERQPVMLAPGVVGSGGGLNVIGRF